MVSFFLQGEVQEIVIHSGVNRSTAILHPGAVYKGQTLPTQVGIEQQLSYTLSYKGQTLPTLVGIEQQPSYTQGLYSRGRLFLHR
jgi:hypothetical protein